ncbi:MAG: hypothetical protein ACFB2X_20945, partial [Rivularia sp. (in: cyanobacteria)]
KKPAGYKPGATQVNPTVRWANNFYSPPYGGLRFGSRTLVGCRVKCFLKLGCSQFIWRNIS